MHDNHDSLDWSLEISNKVCASHWEGKSQTCSSAVRLVQEVYLGVDAHDGLGRATDCKVESGVQLQEVADH